jgi:tetratricopeptide (TPR) repeat protein
MNALLSGQAGIAILVHGDTLSVVQADSPETEREFPHSALGCLLAGATDVLSLQAVSRDELVRRLGLAWRSDRAMQLALLLLDGAEDCETRHLASDCLDDLLREPEVCIHVTNRLYAAPLPETADLNGALTAARLSETVTGLLKDLDTAQPQIRRLREAWDNVPLESFESDSARHAFEQTLVASGAFNAFVMAGGDAARFGLARLEFQGRLKALPNSRRVFESWLKSLQPAGSQRDARVLQGTSEREAFFEADREPGFRKPLSGHEAFENVRRQKEAIVALMRKGDWANVRRYAEELKEDQLRSGGYAFAAKSLCDLAQRAKEVGNCSMQLELAQMAIDTAPEDGWAHGQVADAFFCVGRLDEAANHFEQAGRLGNECFAATGRARILRGQVRLDDALAAYEDAIAKFPEEPIPWAGRAEVLRDMWRLKDALEAYNEAIARFPGERVPLCGKAAVLAKLGSLDEAIDVYDECIRQFEADVYPWCGRAHVLKQKGSLDESLAAFERAIRMFPASEAPLTGHASVLKTQGRLNEALQEYKDVIKQFPQEVMPVIGLAEVFRAMGDLDKALEAYDDAIRKFPHDPVARCARANILKEQGRFEDALQEYDAIVARFPYEVYAWSARADLLKELGHLEDAAEAYDKLMGMAWNPRRDGTQYAKAAVLAAMGQFAEAELLLPTTEPRTHDEWLAYHIRAMILLRNDRLDEAEVLLKKGLRESPYADRRAYFESALAVASLRRRRFREAVRFLGKGDTPLAEVIRMHAFGALKQPDEVKHAYKRIERACPPPLIPLRDELAARYGLQLGLASRDWDWVFEEECRNILYAAA